jgi:predicted secreted protein
VATTLRSFVNDLNQVIQQTKVQSALKLANGSCPTMESYHRNCGRMEGMEETVKVAREMLGQIESAAQDDGTLGELPPAGEGQ